MKNDYGIYILQSLDGYRIAHTQTIENIYFWHICCDDPQIEKNKQIEEDYFEDYCVNCHIVNPKSERMTNINPIILREYFGKSKIYDTEQEVMEEACSIYQKLTIDNEGVIISYIRGYEEKLFPGV